MIDTAPPSRKTLVTFGVTMAVVLAAIAGWRFWRRGLDGFAIAIFITASLFLLSALIAPQLLAAVHRWWMRLADVLGWINTRILLTVIFFLVVTPLGLVMRLFGRNPLDFKKRDSYWTEPAPGSYGDRHYEKQF